MEKFLAGFGRVDITPEESVPLAGYGNTSKRFFQNIRDRIIGNCVAVTDENGNITDVKIEYNENYVDQMLRYSRDYSPLTK